MASSAAAIDPGAAHRDASRVANRRTAGGRAPAHDGQGLVDFRCECADATCERSVKVPLYVYRRLLETADQYLVQAGHHAFPRHRTIVTQGLMRIEERVEAWDASHARPPRRPSTSDPGGRH